MVDLKAGNIEVFLCHTKPVGKKESFEVVWDEALRIFLDKEMKRDVVNLRAWFCILMADALGSQVLHRDIKSQSVLLEAVKPSDDEGFYYSKWADFRTSKLKVEASNPNSLSMQGTTSYRAPGDFAREISDCLSQSVYSFGMACWEIIKPKGEPIAAQAMEDELNSKTLVNSVPRFSFTGSQTCSISINTMPHDLLQYSVSAAMDFTLQSFRKVAEALVQLHSQGIVHRDLKPANILVAEVRALEPLYEGFVNVKLVDFGMAKMKREVTAYSHMTPNHGTGPWMAPEGLGANAGDEDRLLVACPFKTDVYRIGVACSAVLNADTPFQYCTSLYNTTLYKSLMDSLQPSRPELLTSQNCPERLTSLLRMCWHTDPKRRPTFAEICTALRYLENDLLFGYEKLLGLYWGRRSWFNSWSWLAKASATVNRAGKYDREGIMTCRNRTQFVGSVPPEGLVDPVDNTNEHRRQTKKVNADAKLKGESVTALKEIGNVTSRPLWVAPSSDIAAFIWAERGSPLDSSVDELRTAWLNLTEGDETTTALEVLRMAGIAKPFELHEFEPAKKRIRTRDWSAEETRTMLEAVDEALQADMGPDIWGFVSDTLWENYDFDRAPNSCENLWGTLLQSHKATRDQGDTRGSTGFELEFGETIERILPRLPLEGSRNFQTEMGLGLSPSAPPLFQFQSCASESDFSDSAECEEDMSDEEMEDLDTHSDDEGLSGDSTATIESQAEVSHVSRATEPWDESNSNSYGRKRSAARVAEEDLISRIAPFVNRQIEDALKPLLSVLRRREEEQQKHREKLVALEQEKLALKREKMHFTRRVQEGNWKPTFSLWLQ